MYAEGNPQSAKQLREWVASGRKVGVFSPGPFPCPTEGRVYLEGPHYPKPHKWYAQAIVENGIIVKVVK